MGERRFISVIVPLRLGWEPCYATYDNSVSVGDRVNVLLSGKEYTAVVSAVSIIPDTPVSRIRDILGKAPGLESVSPREIEFWRKIASYYLCTVGEVYKAAYPIVLTSREELESRKENRLDERIRKREEALKKARKDSVKERLQGEIESLKSQQFPSPEFRGIPQISLTPKLDSSYVMTCEALGSGKPVLLTGADRGMIYMKAASDTLAKGKSVLFLVPEINSGRGWEGRFRDLFPDLLTYHSGALASSRGEVASRVRGVDPVIVMGTRSSIFLPYRNLGLVVVEQEQEQAYKQDSPAPRYNSRDASILLAKIHGAGVILGSSSPSLESIYNAESGKYVHIGIDQPPGADSQVIVVDTPSERRKRGMVGSFSVKLIENMAGVLESGGQVLLLCPRASIVRDGIAGEVAGLFPGKRVEVLEGSLTQAQQRRVIADFTSGATDILVGAQMIAKGLDTQRLGLIALLRADTISAQDDFRSDERAFQTIRELRERPGGKDCTIVIQTAREGHPVFKSEENLASRLLSERKAASLPPFTRQVNIVMKDTLPSRLEKLSRELRAALPSLPGAIVTGVYQPSSSHPQAQDTRIIGVFLPKDRNLSSSKSILLEATETFGTTRRWSSHISIDVDPQ